MYVCGCVIVYVRVLTSHRALLLCLRSVPLQAQGYCRVGHCANFMQKNSVFPVQFKCTVCL